MKIIILGASGQLGSEVNEILRGKDNEVVSFNSKELDITDEVKLTNVLLNLKPKIIINCSAYTNVDMAQDEEIKCKDLNEIAPKILAQISKKISSVLIHFSTDYVFDGNNEFGYEEDSKTNPLNVYGKYKLLGEEHIRQTLKEHFIIRTSWVFGKNGNNFVKTMMRLFLNKESVNVVNDQYGCPTSARSLAIFTRKVCQLIIKGKNITFGTYNYTNGDKCSWFDFSSEILNLLEDSSGPLNCKLRPVSSDQFKTKAPRPKFSILLFKKTGSIFKIKQLSWKDELKLLVEELSNNG